MPELREAVSAWVEEFRDEGPYEEDVDELVGYLHRVVRDERDMGKAVSVGRWLGWVVGEIEWTSEGEGKRVWREAVERVEEGVQGAVSERGLGRVGF